MSLHGECYKAAKRDDAFRQNMIDSGDPYKWPFFNDPIKEGVLIG